MPRRGRRRYYGAPQRRSRTLARTGIPSARDGGVSSGILRHRDALRRCLLVAARFGNPWTSAVAGDHRRDLTHTCAPRRLDGVFGRTRGLPHVRPPSRYRSAAAARSRTLCVGPHARDGAGKRLRIRRACGRPHSRHFAASPRRAGRSKQREEVSRSDRGIDPGDPDYRQACSGLLQPRLRQDVRLRFPAGHVAGWQHSSALPRPQ